MSKTGKLPNNNKMHEQEKGFHSRTGQSETVLANAFEYSALGMSLISLKGEWIKINSKLCLITGYSHEELFQVPVTKIIHSDDQQKNASCFKKLFNGKIEAFQLEERLMHKKGNAIWVNQNVSLIKDDSQKPLFFLMLTEDIDYKKKIEVELAEIDSKYRTLVEKSLVGVYIIQDGRIKYINPVVAQTVGYDKSELLEADFMELIIAPEDRDIVANNVSRRLAGDIDSIQYVIRGKKKNGEKIWIEVFGNTITYNGRPAIMGTLIDITHKINREQEILDQKIREQKNITRAVLIALEKERNRIGQELHDNINQILAGTKLYLSVAARGSKKLSDQLKRPIELIGSSIREIRLLSSKHVTPLENINLKDLVQLLLKDMAVSTKLKIAFTYKGGRVPLSDSVKLNIYRIIQEQTGNVIRHARAKHFEIRVQAKQNNISVLMKDDGKGFNVKKKRKGIGISNMIHRAESFNGSFVIESAPGKGCTVCVELPVEKAIPA